MTSTLVGVKGHLAGQLFLITDQPLTLGRGSTNDVVLEDAAASRVHAELRRNRGGVVVKDLGSGNGTYVNGKRVTSHRAPLRGHDHDRRRGVPLRGGGPGDGPHPGLRGQRRHGPGRLPAGPPRDHRRWRSGRA